MRYFHAIAVAALVMSVAVGCSSAPPASPPTAAAPTVAPAVEQPTVEQPVVEPTAASGAAAQLENFDPANFSQPTLISNPWMPLTPGMRYVYEGTTVEDDGTAIPHRIEINVTDLNKVIGGIETVVSWDLDYSNDELVEAELAFFAQDNDGNVWRMGEYPEVYEAGAFVEAPTWIHGFEEARAGIMMKAEPQLGTPSYAQGWGPAVDWTDRGQVDQVGQQTCVPVDCFSDVLVIAETSQSEPDAQQLKYYARDIGNVRVGWRGGGEKSKETLELTEVVQLSEEELVEARTAALALEAHAYQASPDVYAQTPPITHNGAVVGGPSAEAPPAEAPASAPAAQGAAEEIVVYTSDLPESAVHELLVMDDPASPGGKLLGVRNNGDELDPPPENDPHAIFTVQVQAGVPYRCWVHMKVGAPKGISTANVVWVQLSNAVDAAGNAAYAPESASYLTAEGPEQEGWAWVPCEATADTPVSFATSGDATVRIQAGMEGVGFDQFILSPADFLTDPPSEVIVEK